MNDKNPNNDQTPESTPDALTVPVEPTSNASTPNTSAPDAETVAYDAPASEGTPVPDASAAAPQPEASAVPAAATTTEAPKRDRKRLLLIGGGVLAAVLLAGGGAAVGAAIADDGDDDDDRSSISDGPRHEEGDRGGQPGEGQRGEGEDRGEGAHPRGGSAQNGSTQNGPVADIGSDSADEIIDIADAARDAADGEITSIDAKRDGSWEVQLTAANGEETEVRVDAALTATVVSTETADGDDTAPKLSLDDDAIRSLVAAALDEAEGRVTDLDVDDDTVSPYDVSVLTADRQSVDIELDASFAVVATDIDD